MLMNANLMTIPELAGLLGVSRISVYNWVRKGQLPAIRVGRNYAIRRADARRLLSPELTKADKARIEGAVSAVAAQYGEVLEWLSRE